MSGDDLLARADRLDDQVAGSDIVRSLVKSSQRTRRLVRLLVVSVTLDVMLSIGLGALALQAQRASQTAAGSTYQLCIADNASRDASLQLWDYVLSGGPSVSMTTPDQKATADRLRARIHTELAQHNCVKP